VIVMANGIQSISAIARQHLREDSDVEFALFLGLDKTNG
jgi:hypothetical protein